MNKINQPLYAKGLSGIPMAFTQIFSQMGQLFFGVGAQANQITKLERMGIWMTSAAVLGPKGIPFSETLMTWADNFIAKDIRIGTTQLKEGDPTNAGLIKAKANKEIADFMIKVFGDRGDTKSVNYWQRFAEGGLITAETGGTINIADRATMNILTNTYYNNIEFGDTFGPGLNLVANMIVGTINGIEDIAEILQDPERELEMINLVKAARKSVGQLGGIRNILGTVEALSEGTISNRMGDAIIGGLSLKEIMLAIPEERFEKVKEVAGIAAGLPGERQRLTQQKGEILARQREAFIEWTTIIARQINRASKASNTTTAFALLGEGMEQTADWMPSKVREFEGRTFWALNVLPGETKQDKIERQAIDFDFEGIGLGER
jgi:hypothetical protein